MKKTESPDREDATAKMGPETFLEIGTFEVVSGTIIVGDPCYEKGDRRAKLLRNVERGTWRAVIVQQVLGPFGLRNVGLMCRHASVRPPWGDLLHHSRFAFDVDSGLAGVFDATLYGGDREDEARRRGDCGAALDSDHGGVAIAHGAVSTSGIGDWRYQGCSELARRGSPVVSVALVFLMPGLLEQVASYEESTGHAGGRI